MSYKNSPEFNRAIFVSVHCVRSASKDDDSLIAHPAYATLFTKYLPVLPAGDTRRHLP